MCGQVTKVLEEILMANFIMFWDNLNFMDELGPPDDQAQKKRKPQLDTQLFVEEAMKKERLKYFVRK